MGEDILNGEFKLFLGDTEIDTKHVNASFDLGEEDGDSGAMSVWTEKGNGNYELNFTIDAKDEKFNDVYLFLKRREESERMMRKALLWAVTHGYLVKIFGLGDNNEMVELSCNRPKPLRWLYNNCPFLPRFSVYDKKGNIHKIKKGKVV